jgi:hypothetical protein
MGAAAILQLRSELHARFDLPAGIRQRPEIEYLTTGISVLDGLTGGGIPRGALTEIAGPASSGRTAIAFSLLRETTRRGECCAWIDAAGTFDPQSAAEAGADLERILWVNCGGVTEHAFQSVDLLIQAGGFGLLVLDLADTPEKEARRIPLASWFRLRHAAERTHTAFIALSQQVNARSCSALQIEMRRSKETRSGPVWHGKLLRGFEAEAETFRQYRTRTARFTLQFSGTR